MSILRAILKVASKDRKVRRLLINEIRKTAGEPSYKAYVERKKKKREKPLSKEDWEARILGKGGTKYKGQEDSSKKDLKDEKSLEFQSSTMDVEDETDHVSSYHAKKYMRKIPEKYRREDKDPKKALAKSLVVMFREEDTEGMDVVEFTGNFLTKYKRHIERVAMKRS